MKSAAIVLSAGSGRRMKSSRPKQYMELAGYPVIYHSLKTFEDSPVDEVILVAGAEEIEYCRREIVERYHLSKVRRIVPGGRERYDSVFEGLKAIGHTDYVLIHDGVRPLLTVDMITRSLKAAAQKNACVMAVPVKDTIKIADTKRFSVGTPDRDTLWQVQTPQTFSYSLIYSAYEKLYQNMAEERAVPAITDDAMVVECTGKCKVYLEMGSYENIKITTPEDLEVAEFFLRKRQRISEREKTK